MAERLNREHPENMSYRITTQAELRREFWQTHAHLPRRYRSPIDPRPSPQNQQPADTRCAFVDYVDSLQKGGDISEQLADRATL